MWAFKTLYDKGLIYEGFRVLAYCWRCETPLSQHRDPDGRRLPRPAGPGADGVVPAARRSRRADRSGSRSGPPRRGRCRPTSPSRSGPTSSTPCSRRTASGVRRRGAARLLRQGSGGLDPGRHGHGRASWPGAGTRRCSTSWSSTAGPNAFQVLAGRLRDHRGRHRRGALRARLRRGRPAAVQRRRHPDRGHGRRPHEVHRARARRTRARRCSRRTSRSPATSRSAASCVRHDTYTHSYPHCWRCDTPLVYKAVSSWFVAVTQFRTGWSS